MGSKSTRDITRSQALGIIEDLLSDASDEAVGDILEILNDDSDRAGLGHHNFYITEGKPQSEEELE